MARLFLLLSPLLFLLAGCQSPTRSATVPEPVVRHLARPLEHSSSYDVDISSRLGKFLVAKGYYVPWTADGSSRIFDEGIRLNSYTTLPNGTNVPYTLSDKARPFVRGTNLRLATYEVEQVLTVKSKKPPKAVRGKVERYALKVEYKITPLLPGMPTVKGVSASVEVDYDLQSRKVLQVAGLDKVARAVRKAIEKELKL